MLLISPAKSNSNFVNKNDYKPVFTGSFKMLTCAYDSTKKYFKANGLYKQNNIFTGIKNFTANAYEIYKNFGFDGIKCLYAESFLGRTNMKTMKKILSENVTAASEHLKGEIVLAQKTYGYNSISQHPSNLLVMYKPNPLEGTTHQADYDRLPEEYFPPQLSVNNIIKTVNNIVNDAEEALANGRLTNTKY